MAFSYKNTLDSAISALPQRYSDQILIEVGDQVEKKLKTVQKLFSYRTTPEVQEMLADEGIELAPISYQNHSHPACKMIENQMLYVTLPHLLKKEYAIGLMSLREEKTKRFIKMRSFLKKGEQQAVKMFNTCLDAKDIYRYGPETESSSFEERVEKIRLEFKEPGFNARVMLIHDELHFHSPEDIAHLFERVEELKAIVGTVVCPPEIILGETKSKNPRIYGFELVDDQLHFFPDSNPSEGYTQPVGTSTWYLQKSMIIKGDLKLSINVLNSCFAHHLVSIERSGSNMKTERFIKKPSCLLQSELILLDNSFLEAQIERRTMSSIMVYLSCLKSPNTESALAKLRQLEKRDLFEDEMNIVAAISDALSKHKTWKKIDLSYLSSIKDSICSSLPWISSFFSEDRVIANMLRAFQKEISVKWLKVNLSKIILDNTRLEIPSPSEYRSTSILEPSCEVRYDVIAQARGEAQPIVFGPAPLLFLEFNRPTSSVDNGVLNEVAASPSSDFTELKIELPKKKGRKNSCVFDSIAPQLDMSREELMEFILNDDPSDELMDAINHDQPLNLQMISELSLRLGRSTVIDFQGRELIMGAGSNLFIKLLNGHCTRADPYVVEERRVSIPSNGSFVYPFNFLRAEKLAKSFSRGTSGARIKEDEVVKQSLMDLMERFRGSDEGFANFTYTWGAPGSGKSKGVEKFLKTNEDVKALVISPRRLLADEWLESLRGSNSSTATFENALAMNLKLFNAIVLDEITLYPPGYTDLIVYKLMADRSGKRLSANKKGSSSKTSGLLDGVALHVIGDPMQSRYYSEDDEFILARKHDVEVMTEQGALRTVWHTYRMGIWFSKVVDMPSSNSKDGVELEKFHFFSGVSAIKGKFDVILCASREDKRNLAGRIPVLTFGEAQGLTFDRALIAITESTCRVSDHHIFVGITRSRKQFHFVVQTDRSPSEILRQFDRKLMGYILQYKTISRERLSALFSSQKPVFLEEALFGSSLSEKIHLDPFIAPFADLSEDTRPEVVIPKEPKPKRVREKVHLPQLVSNPLTEEIFEKMKSKEEREQMSLGAGSSNQFNDLDLDKPELEMGTPMRFEAIFPKHGPTDTTTFFMGVKKRLRFSNTREERNGLRENMAKGERLMKFFISNLPNEFSISKDDIEGGQFDFNAKRAEKPAAMFENHSGRSDIDWPLDWVFLFMKSQLCTKSEKMYSKAKAGQTLACFQHIVLFKFGPMLRAIEKAFNRAVGDKFYIHSLKNFSELNKFVDMNKGHFKGKSIESDYEAFDSSQDSLILAFEVALLKYLGVSRGFIDDYISLKVHLGSKLGQFAIMRFTGEFCTFLFNTFANMLFTMLKYRLDGDVRVLFAGDDMASLGPLKLRGKSGIGALIDSFKLKAKEERKEFPMFCGWILTPDGIYKKPSLLWARLMVMKEKGLLKRCIDNYLLEAGWGYRLGDRLFDYLDIDEMEFHYKTIRFFIEKSHLCKGEALKLIDSFGYTFGNESGVQQGKDYLSRLFIRMKEGGAKDLSFASQGAHAVNSFRAEEIFNGQKSFEILLNINRRSKKEELRLEQMARDEQARSERLNAERIKGIKEREARLLKEFRITGAFNRCMKGQEFISVKKGTLEINLKRSNLPELGPSLNGLKELCQLSKLTTSCSSLNQNSSKLMLSALQKCTAMQGLLPAGFSTALEGLSQTSKFMGTRMRPICQDSLSLMMTNVAGFKEKLDSLTMSTMGRFSSASHLCSQMLTGSKVLSQCLTQRCLMKSKAILPHSKLALERAHRTSLCALGIVYQLLTLIFRELSRCLLNSRVFVHRKVENFSGSMSALCTGLQIPHDSLHLALVQLGGLSRRYRELSSSSLEKICSQGRRLNSNLLRQALNRGVGAHFFRKEQQGGGSTEQGYQTKASVTEEDMEFLKSQYWGNLGLPRSSLIDQEQNYLVSMSLLEVNRAGIRSRVNRFIWENFIDPGREVLAEGLVPELPAEPTDDALLVYNRILGYFLPILFGNIAILGTSGKIIWPDVVVPIPEIKFTVNEIEYSWQTEMILREVCPALEAFRSSSEFSGLRSGTFRSMSEVYASEARAFLKSRRQHNVFTNIYVKWPRALEPAPWVAFDFASGLDMGQLSGEEKTVIDRMTKRIFRTEGQKFVFSAQGEANLQLEG